ncbi:unnamed protein product [Absidia cylindrospora]
MKRAIKYKLAQPKTIILPIYNPHAAHAEFHFLNVNFVPTNDVRRQRQQLITTVTQQTHILEMIGKHYNMHTMIPSGLSQRSNNDIFMQSANQMYSYCNEQNLEDAWAYSVCIEIGIQEVILAGGSPRSTAWCQLAKHHDVFDSIGQ